MEIRSFPRIRQCVSCEKHIDKGDKALYIPTNGADVLICMVCVEQIHDMFAHKYLEETPYQL